MAFGIIQNIIWTGSVKRPVPAILTVSNDWGAQKIAQTKVLLIQLRAVDANLSQINANLAKMVDNLTVIQKNLKNLEASTGMYGISIQQKNAIKSALTTSQIQFDNFFRELNGEKPTLPSIEEQLKKSIKESLIFNQVVGLQGLINNQISTMMVELTNSLKGSELYKGVTGWVKNQISVITTPIKARSAEFIKSVTSALTGIKASI